MHCNERRGKSEDAMRVWESGKVEKLADILKKLTLGADLTAAGLTNIIRNLQSHKKVGSKLLLIIAFVIMKSWTIF